MLFIIQIEHVHNGVLIVKQKRYKSSPNLGYRMACNQWFHGTQVDFFRSFVSNIFLDLSAVPNLKLSLTVIESDLRFFVVIFLG